MSRFLTKLENNDDNCLKLAKLVVDSWDMDTLVSFAVEQLTINYMEDNNMFQEDCELFIEK